jgi:L-seryl-tRNA(Ser) seleniumtransferase
MRLTSEEMLERCERFLAELGLQLPAGEVESEIVDGYSLAGGGSTPSQSLPTKLLRFASVRHSATRLEKRLRRGASWMPVIARVEEDRLIIDLRTVFLEQEPLLAKALSDSLH